MKRNLISLFSALFASILLTACGGGVEVTDDGIEFYVYIPAVVIVNTAPPSGMYHQPTKVPAVCRGECYFQDKNGYFYYHDVRGNWYVCDDRLLLCYRL